MAIFQLTPTLTDRPRIHIDTERCVGCEECARVCPKLVLALDAHRAIIAVENDECVGCRACERTCPYDAIHISGPLLTAPRAPEVLIPMRERLGTTQEVCQGLSFQQMAEAADRCLNCPRPTCVIGCPAHNDIPGFIQHMRAGRMQDALDTLRVTSEFPSICGRVCNQAIQCEGACILNQQGEEAVAIGSLERYLGDWERVTDSRERQAIAPIRRKKVAVVGAGPGGLAAAGELARAGHRVEIHEALPFLGGVMAWGIPAFTLPDAVLNEEMEYLEDIGVTFHLSRRLGQDFEMEDLFAQGADAVVLAVGASQPNRLPMPEADTLHGVTNATEFLMRGKRYLAGMTQYKPDVKSPLVVIGAGNTGIDVARTAVRLGVQDALCIDFLPEKRVPCAAKDKHHALDEGVRFMYQVSVEKLVGDDTQHTRALRVVPMVWPAPSLFHRHPRPRPDAAGSYELPALNVVQAMGYKVETETQQHIAAIPVTPRGTLLAESGTGRTQHTRVWAIGDLVTGPATVVGAMAMGRRCAADVLTWLEG